MKFKKIEPGDLGSNIKFRTEANLLNQGWGAYVFGGTLITKTGQFVEITASHDDNVQYADILIKTKSRYDISWEREAFFIPKDFFYREFSRYLEGLTSTFDPKEQLMAQVFQNDCHFDGTLYVLDLYNESLRYKAVYPLAQGLTATVKNHFHFKEGVDLSDDELMQVEGRLYLFLVGSDGLRTDAKTAAEIVAGYLQGECSLKELEDDINTTIESAKPMIEEELSDMGFETEANESFLERE